MKARLSRGPQGLFYELIPLAGNGQRAVDEYDLNRKPIHAESVVLQGPDAIESLARSLGWTPDGADSANDFLNDQDGKAVDDPGYFDN